MSKLPKEDVDFVIRIVCQEVADGTPAQRIARRLKSGGMHSLTFLAATSGGKCQVEMPDPLQDAIFTAMRDMELGIVDHNKGPVAFKA